MQYLEVPVKLFFSKEFLSIKINFLKADIEERLFSILNFRFLQNILKRMAKQNLAVINQLFYKVNDCDSGCSGWMTVYFP